MHANRSAALTNFEAWQALGQLESDPRVAWAEEPKTITAKWQEFAVRRSPSPKLWMDAYLAAFAVTGGYQLVTADRAFLQFQGLNPLILT